MATLKDYAPIVGPAVIDELMLIGERLKGREIVHVNSTAVGGGVAEILTRMIPLMNETGPKTRWEVIKGGQQFFAVTKKFHNALHGVKTEISSAEQQIYLDTQKENLDWIDLNGDVRVIHDPQPLTLIQARDKFKGGPWVWRCHIDISHALPSAWSLLKNHVNLYDSAIFSAPPFTQPDLSLPQTLIAPSIDPLADKNRELEKSEIDAVFEKLQVPRDKPIVTQIGRFDRLKDPLGVVEVYKRVAEDIDCRLLLAGGGADDDPEGAEVLAEVREAAGKDPNIHILELPVGSDIEINALVRGSTVVLQKSLREGFALTVSEALWKGVPVIASAVGGIPLQITHKHGGILTRSIDGTVYWLRQLLNEPDYAKKIAAAGKEHIRSNYLLTRHLRDYLLLSLWLLGGKKDVLEL